VQFFSPFLLIRVCLCTVVPNEVEEPSNRQNKLYLCIIEVLCAESQSSVADSRSVGPSLKERLSISGADSDGDQSEVLGNY
jgi:hypothetical protein